MPASTKPAVVALALCAMADLAAVPALVAESDGDAPVLLVGGLALVFGALTAWAAVGIARRSSWAVPLALVTRTFDVAAALPGLGAGPGAAAAVITLIVLSVVAAVLVLKLRQTPVAA